MKTDDRTEAPDSTTASSTNIMDAGVVGRSGADPSRQIERAEKEYADLSQNMRHYGNVRFAQLTLFSAITAGLAKVALENAAQWPQSLRITLCVAGILVALSFWTMEERAADYWHHFRRRADKLETTVLQYQQYSTKKGKILSATNAARFLFLLAVAAWLSGLIVIISR